MSSIPKLEEYQIANMNLSIEDYKQKPRKGESHFFPRASHKRYFCWVNGGGLGEADTLGGAREILFGWATARLDEDAYNLNEKLYVKLHAKRQLDDNVDNLQGFKVNEGNS